MKEYIVTVYGKEDTPGKLEGTYWKNTKGQYHREDGPAVEYANGNVKYYLNDSCYSKEGWQAELDRRNKPAAVKMTVAEIAAKLGHDVEVVKG